MKPRHVDGHRRPGGSGEKKKKKTFKGATQPRKRSPGEQRRGGEGEAQEKRQMSRNACIQNVNYFQSLLLHLVVVVCGKWWHFLPSFHPVPPPQVDNGDARPRKQKKVGAAAAAAASRGCVSVTFQIEIQVALVFPLLATEGGGVHLARRNPQKKKTPFHLMAVGDSQPNPFLFNKNEIFFSREKNGYVRRQICEKTNKFPPSNL